jgi:SAM-dependent methyltransferase
VTDHEERKRVVLDFFDGLIGAAAGSGVLGYGSNRSQQVRFEALCRIDDLDGMSVLDVGCGRGDLCGYLAERGKTVTYRGVDIHPGMIDLATRTWPAGAFAVRDLLDTPDDAGAEVDYVLCSGLFSLTVHDDASFIERMLRIMLRLARKGVAVNFLSNRTPFPMDHRSYYADPTEMLARALELTPNVALLHDYKDNDFALHMRHGRPGEAAS